MWILEELNGKKAIVTGSTRGLGLGMAEALLEQGVEVIIWGTSDRVKIVAEQFRSRNLKCHAVIGDLADPDSRMHAMDQALQLLDSELDILVNAAGIQRRHASEVFPAQDWELVLEVNLVAPFYLSQRAAEIMLKKGRGKIINVVSMNTFFGGMNIPAYAASKGGLAQMTKTMCNDWASRGIYVNGIAPGYMTTDMNEALMDQSKPRYKEITERIPQGRWGTPEDMKGCCLFLASSMSDYVNGAIIPIDGGYLGK